MYVDKLMAPTSHGSPGNRAQVDDRPVVLILFTTRYREGGREMQAAAQWMAEEKRREFPVAEVQLHRIESKSEFLAAIGAAVAPGSENGEPRRLRELHFIGHSGLYGPMFGTRAHPEQMSRYEWSQLDLPFTRDGEAFFHCCRSGPWFAPFFSRRYGVVTHGHYSYTTFSRAPDRYVPLGAEYDSVPVYVLSTPGYKGMGLRGLIQKRVLGGRAIPLLRFEPQPEEDGSYDGAADLYDAVFEDFQVRHDEWKWLNRQLADRQDQAEVLDIGCGNGALLLAFAPLIRRGVGVDAPD